MISRADWIAAVRRCVGTPVGHHGRIIGKALDCVGVPWAAAVSLGLDLAPTPRYRRVPTGEQLRAGLALYCDEVCDSIDAHILQVFAGAEARHVVVPVGQKEDCRLVVVHAWGKHSEVRETVLSDRIAHLWRVRGVA